MERLDLKFESGILSFKNEDGEFVIRQEIFTQEERELAEEYTAAHANDPDPMLDINFLKQQKIDELRNLCNTTILSGFYSSASGENLLFGSDETDQLNLLGQMAALSVSVEPIVWKVKGILQFVQLSKEQFTQLYLDGKTHKETNMLKYFGLVSQVNAAQTIEEIENIVW